jgi:5-hydroxyisourate hydrolase
MGHDQPTVSTHVLDTERGRPATGIAVSLYRREGDAERLVGEGTTDGDGRIARLIDDALVAGEYRLVFDLGHRRFFTRASLELTIDDASRSYHVPLLLARYSLTTYRGS